MVKIDKISGHVNSEVYLSDLLHFQQLHQLRNGSLKTIVPGLGFIDLISLQG
jgi:hypothetical protein